MPLTASLEAAAASFTACRTPPERSRGAWVAARNRYVRYGAMTIAVGAGEIACGPACAVGVGTALYVADNADEPR